MEFVNYRDMRKLLEPMFWLQYWMEMPCCFMEKKDLLNIKYQELISEFLDFWRFTLHRFNGKFTLTLCDAQILEIKKIWN